MGRSSTGVGSGTASPTEVCSDVGSGYGLRRKSADGPRSCVHSRPQPCCIANTGRCPMNRFALALSALVLWPSSDAFSRAQRRTDCLLGLAPALITGSFSGSTDCKNDQLKVRKLGSVQRSGDRYTVYDYRYRLRPPCRECAIHGGQRIIFMKNARYLGQYGVLMYNARATLRGDKLILTPESDIGVGQPVTLHLTADGPPRRGWFDGEALELFK